MESTPDDLSALSTAIRQGTWRFARRLRAERGDADLSNLQRSVLIALSGTKKLTPSQLAEHERVQPPVMTRTVNALEELGLVNKEPCPDDKRQVLVGLTAAGRADAEATHRRRESWLVSRLQELSPSDREVLTRAAELLTEISRK